ncbi:ribonuclease E activity regulator RraA [Methyloligella sp. 2.7D]|uniref:ribonuclease E activity regulator RraA n=1 Tax=unclassified Methyloligella TaxID=2625955 RepID=UPI00157CFF64|nr:ribonuclease E activity regulator RraA [Methyloligella sp. GL2]QKP78420.1 ribonuclease E activity regulator RraA [Methyloligella sp. GL2]
MTYPCLSKSTCDLYDQFLDEARVPSPIFRDFGGKRRFGGTVATVKCFEDNSRIKEQVATDGTGKVLVVDAGGSLRCAVLGDLVAGEAAKNGWEGIIVLGGVRDSAALAEIDIGIKALGTNPRKSVRRGEGSVALRIDIAGASVEDGDVVVCDEDGIIVLTEAQAKA